MCVLLKKKKVCLSLISSLSGYIYLSRGKMYAPAIGIYWSTFEYINYSPGSSLLSYCILRWWRPTANPSAPQLELPESRMAGHCHVKYLHWPRQSITQIYHPCTLQYWCLNRPQVSMLHCTFLTSPTFTEIPSTTLSPGIIHWFRLKWNTQEPLLNQWRAKKPDIKSKHLLYQLQQKYKVKMHHSLGLPQIKQLFLSNIQNQNL